MEVKVVTRGWQELEARLTEIEGLGGQKLLQRALRKVAKPLFNRARSNASAVGRSQALALSIAIVTRRTAQSGTYARTRGRASGRGNVVARVAVGSVAKSRRAVALYNSVYRKRGIYARKGIFYGWMLDQGHRIGTRSTGWLKKVGIGSRAMTDKGLRRYAARLAAGRLKTQTRGEGSGGRVTARPWWTPAVQASEPAMERDFLSIVAKALKKIESRKSKSAQIENLVQE